MSEQKTRIGYIKNVEPSERHLDPEGTEFFTGRQVRVLVRNYSTGAYESQVMYIKDDSCFALICPKVKSLLNKRFFISVHLEYFAKSGSSYIVIDGVSPYITATECNAVSEEDFDKL